MVVVTNPKATEEELASAEFFQQYHLYASDVDLASTGSAAVTCNMTAGVRKLSVFYLQKERKN